MNADIALDHVGVVARDLGTVAAQYDRLGFTLTPRVLTAGGRIANRCAMLGQGYMELMALAPGGKSTTLDRFLARFEGAHIIAFSVDDLAVTRTRLARAGFGSLDADHSERPVDRTANGPLAHFAHLPIAARMEIRFNLIQHLTPDLLWQKRFLAHMNHAVGLEEATLAVTDPATVAAYVSRLSGRVVVPDPAGGFRLDVSRGRIHLLLPDVFPTSVPAPPSIAAVTLRTDDGNAAITRIAEQTSVPHRTDHGRVIVLPEAAGGVELHFVG